MSRMRLENQLRNQIIVSLRSQYFKIRFSEGFCLISSFLENSKEPKTFLRETKSLAFFAPWLKTSTVY